MQTIPLRFNLVGVLQFSFINHLLLTGTGFYLQVSNEIFQISSTLVLTQQYSSNIEPQSTSRFANQPLGFSSDIKDATDPYFSVQDLIVGYDDTIIVNGLSLDTPARRDWLFLGV